MTQEVKYYGNYVGIVVQNNDPLGKGRVKVYIPHVSPNVYKRWNEVSTDKKFKFLGGNIQSDLSKIVEELKEILPWCICASPLVGENTSGRYNTTEDYGTTSDSNFYGLSGFKTDNPKSNNSTTTDGTGEKAGAIYEKYATKLSDPFSNPKQSKANQVNLYSNEYTPSTYSNKAKGSFSIPAVGSHVWVFFYEGDPYYPVYWAAAFGKDDWNQIYNFENKTSLDYPTLSENVSVSSNTPDVDQYRNKMIINQKGGTLEINNSDNREAIKITHYSGSFKSFTNNTNVELAVKNDQKMVLEDQFYTVKGYKNLYTGRDEDHIIKGDYYQKIGNLDHTNYEEWKGIVENFATIKQLFDIRRAEYIQSTYQKYTSIAQKREGTFAPCPVCLGKSGKEYVVINNTSSIQGSTPTVLAGVNQVSNYSTVTQPLFGAIATNRQLPQKTVCPVCNGTGISPSTKDGSWVNESLKQYNTLRSLYNDNITKLADIESKMGLGGNQIVDISKHKVETIGLLMNDFGSIRVDSIGKIDNSEVLVDTKGVFVSQKESPLIEYVHVDDLPGGNYTLTICNRYNLLVGAGGMNFKSYGPVNISGTIANIGGTQTNISSDIETNINAGKRITLTAEQIILKNKTGGQVLVDSNLGVNGNVVVRGGMHVDGELSINHVTAPIEIQETELTRVLGKLLQGLTFQCLLYGVEQGSLNDVALATAVLTSDSIDNRVEMYPHSHHFKNIPIKLVPGNDAVRDLAKANNTPDINPALPIRNEYKPN